VTECTSTAIRAKAPGRREYVARFDGGDISSDGGALLLGRVESRRRILARLSDCFVDRRDPGRVEHSIAELVAQRVLAIALGYEDVNDHEALRQDPLLSSLVGKRDPKGVNRKRERDTGSSLASPSTLSRLENGHPGFVGDDRYRRIALDFQAADQLLIDLFLEAHDEPPSEIFIDLDATDDRVHGEQQKRFFHGYYDHYCFLPLYIFCGDHLLAARLRPSNIDGAKGSIDELDRIVGRIRDAWPETRIVVRGDSGFCREWLMAWCERENVDYVLGLARNSRLEALIEEPLDRVRKAHEVSRRAEREYAELTYRTKGSWSRSRRVVAKAEHLARGAIRGFTTRGEHLQEVARRNPILVTALTPRIGYDRASEIVREAESGGKSIVDAAVDLTGLSREEIESALDPGKLTGR